MPALTSPLVCRPALPGDTPDMHEITRDIWEGHDYVPLMWEEWLADPHGLLAVAEAGGKVLGLGKLTLLDPGSWWLEGLRVHPEYQGQGIASHMHEYLLDVWLRQGDGSLRLATASQRLPVHHLCARTGFEKAAELSYFGAETLPGSPSSLLPLRPEEAERALQVALESETLRYSAGLMDLIWQWSKPSLRLIEAAARNGLAWWWPGSEGLVVIGEDDEHGETYLHIQLLAGPAHGLPRMLLAFRALAGELGYPDARWSAPLHPDLLPQLKAAGFKREWDDSLYIYARPHPEAGDRGSA